MFNAKIRINKDGSYTLEGITEKEFRAKFPNFTISKDMETISIDNLLPRELESIAVKGYMTGKGILSKSKDCYQFPNYSLIDGKLMSTDPTNVTFADTRRAYLDDEKDDVTAVDASNTLDYDLLENLDMFENLQTLKILFDDSSFTPALKNAIERATEVEANGYTCTISKKDDKTTLIIRDKEFSEFANDIIKDMYFDEVVIGDNIKHELYLLPILKSLVGFFNNGIGTLSMHYGRINEEEIILNYSNLEAANEVSNDYIAACLLYLSFATNRQCDVKGKVSSIKFVDMYNSKIKHVQVLLKLYILSGGAIRTFSDNSITISKELLNLAFYYIELSDLGVDIVVEIDSKTYAVIIDKYGEVVDLIGFTINCEFDVISCNMSTPNKLLPDGVLGTTKKIIIDTVNRTYDIINHLVLLDIDFIVTTSNVTKVEAIGDTLIVEDGMYFYENWMSIFLKFNKIYLPFDGFTYDNGTITTHLTRTSFLRSIASIKPVHTAYVTNDRDGEAQAILSSTNLEYLNVVENGTFRPSARIQELISHSTGVVKRLICNDKEPIEVMMLDRYVLGKASKYSTSTVIDDKVVFLPHHSYLQDSPIGTLIKNAQTIHDKLLELTHQDRVDGHLADEIIQGLTYYLNPKISDNYTVYDYYLRSDKTDCSIAKFSFAADLSLYIEIYKTNLVVGTVVSNWNDCEVKTAGTTPVKTYESSETTIEYSFTKLDNGKVEVTYQAKDKDGNDVTDDFYVLQLIDEVAHKEMEQGV